MLFRGRGSEVVLSSLSFSVISAGGSVVVRRFCVYIHTLE